MIAAIRAIFSLYSALIFIYIIMSWFPLRGTLYDAYRVLGSVVDPYLNLFRNLIPPLGGLDFSPWVAILVLSWVIEPLVLRALSLLNLG